MTTPAAATSPDTTPSLLPLPVAAMRQLVEQLQRLDRLLESAAQRMVEALATDLGRPEVEASFELVSLRQELRHTRRHLAGWMRPRRRSLPLWAWPGQGAVRAEPLGCVLIIGAWNYRFDLCLHPPGACPGRRQQRRGQTLRAEPGFGGLAGRAAGQPLSTRGGPGGLRRWGRGQPVGGGGTLRPHPLHRW